MDRWEGGITVLTVLFPDVASTEQQKAAGPQQDQEEEQNDEDVPMETESQEEQLEAAEVQELKPEQLDSSRASHKGEGRSSCLLNFFHLRFLHLSSFPLFFSLFFFAFPSSTSCLLLFFYIIFLLFHFLPLSYPTSFFLPLSSFFI